MPRAARRACHCGQVQPCAAHVWKQRWEGRPSARSRGYTYAWDKRAKDLREAGTLCAYCHAAPMAQLDHHVPLHKGGSTDPDENGVPACTSCHDIKTRREGLAARRASSPRHFESATMPSTRATKQMRAVRKERAR